MCKQVVLACCNRSEIVSILTMYMDDLWFSPPLHSVRLLTYSLAEVKTSCSLIYSFALCPMITKVFPFIMTYAVSQYLCWQTYELFKFLIWTFFFWLIFRLVDRVVQIIMQMMGSIDNNTHWMQEIAAVIFPRSLTLEI